MKDMIKRLTVMLIVGLMISSLAARFPLTEEGKSPFVEVVKNIRESVVNILVEAEAETRMPSGRFPFDDDIFKFFFSPNPEPRRSTSMGSGFIIDRNKDEVFILTNNHVVDKGDKSTITVTLADKAKYKATVVGLDPQTDLAVIKISIPKKESVVIVPLGDSDQIEIGEWAIAIGNPFGQLGLDRTVTVGVISATGRASLDFGGNAPLYQDYIQTDAAINPGNSGGPLLNIKGEVIGINTAITTTSGGNIGIGFAIPINMAKKVVNDIVAKGRVIRSFLGILPQEITTDLQKSLGLEKIKGVLVASVDKGTPAEKAGLKNGDVIIEFNGQEVQNVARFRIAVANAGIGKEVKIKVFRNGRELSLKAKLEEVPDEERIAERLEEEKVSWLGIEVESLRGDFAKRQQINADYGVVVTSIERNSAASKSDLRVGEVIQEINHKKIESVKDYENAIKEIESKHKSGQNNIVLCYVLSKNGNYRYVTINLADE